MAQSSARLLELLALLVAGDRWPAAELAARLGISTRTLRRDVATLQALDYPVRADRGVDGGYRFGSGANLPPLILDADQAVAVAVALQVAPDAVTGIEQSLATALEVLRQAMSRRLQSEVDAFRITALPHAWDFGVPPLPAAVLRSVGLAVHGHELLRFDHARPDGSYPDPRDPDFEPPLEVEPHHLVVWARRWYVVAYRPATAHWATYRVDRMRPKDPTRRRFSRREVPGGDVGEWVRTDWDRGDTPAPWPCQGSAVLPYPAADVARWAPGGSVVEPVGDRHARLRLGAWSWEAVAGLLATYAAPLAEVEPVELRDACRRVAGHLTGRTP